MKKSIGLLVLFVFASFVTVNIPVMADSIESLYMGRLSILETDILELPVYYVSGGIVDSDTSQWLVDQENLAIYLDCSVGFRRVVSPIIADHKYQNSFNQLYNVEEDRTIATLELKDGTKQIYICREKDDNGINDKANILDSERNIACLKYPADWIIIYTCSPEGWWRVTLTFWEPWEPNEEVG